MTSGAGRVLEALRHHAAGLLALTVGACLLGGVALLRLPAALYPEVTFPRVVIAATEAGASAQTMQLSVTRPLEEALSTVLGVRRVRSRTIRAASEVSLWFDPNTDMELALQRVNARVAEVRGELPRDVDVLAERLTPSSFPVITLAVTGTANPSVLREAALYGVRPRLAGLPGVGRVSVTGGDVRELEVVVNPAKLEAAGLDMAALSSALSEALPNEAAGRIDIHYQQSLILVQGAVNDTTALEATVVGGTPGVPVRLSDVARVEEGHADRLALTSADGRPAVLVNVGRRPDADAVELARDVREQVAAMRESLPPGVEVRAVYDQAGLIAKAVANVRDAVLVGGLLTLVVVAAFLRSWRATLAAAAALPATLLMTFAVMRLAGASLNLMSLGGLAVAIGLVVDDAVVVVEAVYRRVVGEKMEPWHASAEALREVAWPVVNSTLTTVVVFAPLSLLSGVSGQFFAALALTLCAAVLLSLLVALGLTPLLCGRLMRSEETPSHGPRSPRVEALVSRVQARPGRTLALAGVGALLLAVLGWGVGTGFLPELDEGAFVVDYFTPTGTSLVEADRLAGEVEAVLRSAPEVEVLSRRLGAELGPPAATESSRGDITVTLSPARSRPTEEIIAELRERMEKAVPGVRVEFVELLQDELSDLEGNPEPMEVMLLGSDVDVLRAYAPEVADQLEGIPGLVDLYNGVSGCTPETHVRVRPAAAGRLGLTAGQVATQVRTALLGEVVAQVPRAGRLLNVRLRLEDAARFDPQVLDRLRLHTAAGPPAPLTSVADVESLCLPSELLSDNLRPLVPITGRLEGRDLGGVTSDVEARLAKLHPPSGVQVSVGGQRASQRDSFQALALVFALALGAVFAVLTFHFRSLVLPLLILGAVPLALAAGTAALRVFGVPLNVSSFMGLILLVGLVVKNGILLLDHAEAALEHGSALGQAVVTAVSVRLRPILMTTLATLLGLLPLGLGLGTGAELQRPLAVAVMGGLSFSTLAVLTALPAAYTLVRARFARKGTV